MCNNVSFHSHISATNEGVTCFSSCGTNLLLIPLSNVSRCQTFHVWLSLITCTLTLSLCVFVCVLSFTMGFHYTRQLIVLMICSKINEMVTWHWRDDLSWYVWRRVMTDGPGLSAGGRYRSWKRRWFILNDNCLYYFEFTTVSLH